MHLLRIDKASQLGKKGPTAGNRVRDSPWSHCKEFHMKTKLHNYNICCMYFLESQKIWLSTQVVPNLPNGVTL